MSMIKIENLTFSYPGSSETVFENCSFQIDTDWKLGFVGRNGRGKTTLLRLLQGKYTYTGSIIRSVSFDYFPCPVKDPGLPTRDVLAQVCPEAQNWQILREFSLMGTAEEILWQPFETLSGGEQTRALLAAFFLHEGYFPLIDEPTNHLDKEARAQVAAYLKKKKGFILVSHDRAFLDGCVDHILSLNRATVEVQSGNFSSWMENFERQLDFEQARNDRIRKDIRRLEEAARRTSSWSDRTEASKFGNGPVDRGFVGHKAAKMMKRSRVLEARREKAVQEKAGLLKNVETAESLKLFPLVHHSETLASLAQVSPCYGETPVCSPVTFEVRRGERILLEGKNGSGKSSLLKLLAGKENAGSALTHTGTLTLASGLIVSLVPQDTSFLRGSMNRFAADQGLDETLFFAVLRKLDFERSAFTRNMEQCSAGQKKKILIARSLCQRAHLYLWDEPLNYIDIYSRTQVEQLILEFAPTMVFVEHDQAFQERIATKKIAVS